MTCGVDVYFNCSAKLQKNTALCLSNEDQNLNSQPLDK